MQHRKGLLGDGYLFCKNNFVAIKLTSKKKIFLHETVPCLRHFRSMGGAGSCALALQLVRSGGLTHPTSQGGLICRGRRMEAPTSVRPQPSDLATRVSATGRLSAVTEYWLPTPVWGHVYCKQKIIYMNQPYLHIHEPALNKQAFLIYIKML